MRKRMLGALLVLMLFASVICVSAVSAADTTRIEFGEVSGKAGERVEVPVTITGNPGIAGFRFWVAYDMEALTLVSVEQGEALTGGTLKFNVDDEDATITWFALSDVTGNGEIMSLTFDILEDATGNYPLTIAYDPEDIVNASWQQVECTVTDGNIKAENLNGLLYSIQDNQVTITDYTGNGGNLIIPDTIDGLPVTGIGDNAYKDCTTLTSIIIPNSITTIGSSVFYNCTSLTEVIYCGTQEQWNGVNIGNYNDSLTAKLKFHNVENGVCTICGYKPLYTVTFKDWDNAILSTNTYHWGDAVVVPANPTKLADETYIYTFAGWDKTVVNCAGDATYTATYTPAYINYTVTFKNWDGSVLSSNMYHYNDTVTPPSATPTKPEDSTYKYVFKGWDSEIVKVVGNKIYTAIYDAIKKIVEITSNVFHIQGDSIGKVGVGTSANSFVSNLSQSGSVQVYKGSTQISGNTAIGTGMEVKLMDGNTVVKSYTVVVTGDTNGDGAISVTDMIAVKAHVLKKTLLTGAYADAGDTSNDNAISITDFIQIKAQILGKSSIIPN